MCTGLDVDSILTYYYILISLLILLLNFTSDLLYSEIVITPPTIFKTC